ncbi:hypothetical protein [Aliamphritea ceti]|uniref:hypothetical protein n=1 Tax=Aliamphritea ceti TaxID=1524258 RepID=UPI0021C2961A|nr:hypothetical protein [Aliamphritea ceti]
MYYKQFKYLSFCTLLLLHGSNAGADTQLPTLPKERYNSQINASDFIITQEQKGKWAVNCRQRIQPQSGDNRCSATDGRQILKFKAPNPAPPPAQAFKQAAVSKHGYILQLAAFPIQQDALKFQSTHPDIASRIISTTTQNITLFNVITSVIDDFESAQAIATKTSETLGYLPWIRTTDSL